MLDEIFELPASWNFKLVSFIIIRFTFFNIPVLLAIIFYKTLLQPLANLTLKH